MHKAQSVQVLERLSDAAKALPCLCFCQRASLQQTVKEAAAPPRLETEARSGLRSEGTEIGGNVRVIPDVF